MIKIKLKDWKTFYPGQVIALPDEMAKRLIQSNVAELMERQTATIDPPEHRAFPQHEDIDKRGKRKHGN